MSLEYQKREIVDCKSHSQNQKELNSSQKCRGKYSGYMVENVRQYNPIKPIQYQLAFSKIRSEDRMPCVQKISGDLCCEAIISCSDGCSYRALNKNDADRDEREKTKETFREHRLAKLADIKKCTNEPGACAEPRAVAKALCHKKKTQGIKNIYVGEAEFTDQCRSRVSKMVASGRDWSEPEVSFAKALLGRMPKKKSKEDADKIFNSKETYPPCQTCEQWIGNNRKVKPEYIPKI